VPYQTKICVDKASDEKCTSYHFGHVLRYGGTDMLYFTDVVVRIKVDSTSYYVRFS